MSTIRIEVGILRGEETVWPVDFRTYATPEKCAEAIPYVMNLAANAGEKITGVKTTKYEG